jgi:hypothetical protein
MPASQVFYIGVADKLSDNFSAPMAELFVVVFGAVDVALERGFNLWAILANLHRLFPACNHSAPLRIDAD